MCLIYCVVPCLDQNTGVNVSDLLCGTETRPEYVVNVSEYCVVPCLDQNTGC